MIKFNMAANVQFLDLSDFIVVLTAGQKNDIAGHIVFMFRCFRPDRQL